MMKILHIVFLLLLCAKSLQAEEMLPLKASFDKTDGTTLLILFFLIIKLIIVLALDRIVKRWYKEYMDRTGEHAAAIAPSIARELDSQQIARATNIKAQLRKTTKEVSAFVFILFLIGPQLLSAQTKTTIDGSKIWQQPGIIITIVLVAIPIIVGLILMIIRLKKTLNKHREVLRYKDAEALSEYLETMPEQEQEELKARKDQSDFKLTHTELSGAARPHDSRGLLVYEELTALPVVPIKKKALPRPQVDPKLAHLVQWYLISATFWLLFGTTVGEYLGIKFMAPNLDDLSWLSFGRLRPVHTNAVFWGWASLGMLGLGYYIVPRVSNTALARLKWAWYGLYFINASVFLGSISLMAGINNGGGEYREYIWPIMLLFAIGIGLSFGSYYKTIAQRKTKEIYISSWYILSAVIFITVTAIVGYVPWWQDGLGETIVQGYYMHQAVGMWFMLFTLGIVYYFLPQQLNQPIYSYRLGIMAFWTQILFYTLIGTHHFIFSAIPWWIQTVAIVASVGMVIPVVAGTTNFLLTFRGAWHRLNDSYTLPFFLVGIIFYFTGSMQGTAEAFRYTNLLWHFTDFTVAHSHMTMYGIITFLLWGGIYALMPRLSGQEAPQSTVGAHFWLALIGLMFYSVSLMYGGTLRGLAWIVNTPFIETVTLMMPYWLWRAIGGTLMWISHLFFAYNLYKMLKKPQSTVDVADKALDILEGKINSNGLTK